MVAGRAAIHRSAWPTAAPLRAAAGDGDPPSLAVAADVLGEVRRAKTEAKRSMRAEVARRRGHRHRRAARRPRPGRRRRAAAPASSTELDSTEGRRLRVDVTLAPEA